MSVDRNSVLSAVERYLSQRGVSVGPQTSSVAQQVVDRFIDAKRAPVAEVPAPEPQVAVVDFVCEDDVRQAMRKGAKIFTGPKTIITPSARDLGEQHGILIAAERQ